MHRALPHLEVGRSLPVPLHSSLFVALVVCYITTDLVGVFPSFFLSLRFYRFWSLNEMFGNAPHRARLLCKIKICHERNEKGAFDRAASVQRKQPDYFGRGEEKKKKKILHHILAFGNTYEGSARETAGRKVGGGDASGRRLAVSARYVTSLTPLIRHR
ncbi:hypothetical protein PUN28_007701 [Cardiocondyla obscurior]|uniref:Uncharacterized protein n=1 Tax=Cardiocondyla obscurior TaxID=286306 RepID=A0AAW2FVY9_9HYME